MFGHISSEFGREIRTLVRKVRSSVMLKFGMFEVRNIQVRPNTTSKAHFHDCNLLVIIHSRVDDFQLRMAVHKSWMKYITDGKVVNTYIYYLPFGGFSTGTIC